MDPKERYIHLSKKKIRNLKDIDQNKFSSNIPKGLWFSRNDKWINYLDENNSKELYGFIYQINLLNPITKKLKDFGKNMILKVGTEKKLGKFILKYGKDDKINWMNVANDFNGILFEPFIKDLDKEKYKWYSNLFVSSGCVWKKDSMEMNFLYEHKRHRSVRFNPEIQSKRVDQVLC